MCTCYPTKYVCWRQVKFITVWENKRPYNVIQIHLNPVKVRTWNMVMEEITAKLRPEFAIYQLMNLRTNEVARNFFELEDNGLYVALDHKHKPKLKKSLKYRDLTFSQIHLAYHHVYRMPQYNQSLYNFNPCVPSINRFGFLKKTKERKKTIIFIYRNGCNKCPPRKFVFTHEELQDWNRVMKFIGDELHVEEGVDQLFTVKGDPVWGYWDIQHGSAYVAVGFRDTFKQMNYLEYCRQYLPGRSRYCISETAISSPISVTPTHVRNNQIRSPGKVWGMYMPAGLIKIGRKCSQSILNKKKGMLDKKSFNKVKYNVLFGTNVQKGLLKKHICMKGISKLRSCRC